MDPSFVFQQGFQAPPLQPTQPSPNSHRRDDTSETDGNSNRVAHTLTACCRCRKRKTRCDPSLPRCLPCDRSGVTCEYYDATKGRLISRSYVITLQDRVRALEAELRTLTEEEGDFSHNRDELVRRGGLVRLSAGDESVRYLGPSSGIAMSRLLMEEAKLFTDSKRISELIPEVRARREKREARMQSVVMTNAPPRRKSTYPMFSDHPAPSLPSRPLVSRLVEIFSQRATMFWPVVHEQQFAKDLEDVYAGDEDPYKNYVVRMVIAISLHKLEPQYAGLADSYYLAAMQLFEEVVRPRDLKSLQCLILVGQYSILAPTRMAIYFVIGLATRICQATGLCFEKTITSSYNAGLESPLTLDMRRRLSWIVASMEYGLSHTMGRPNAFGQSEDEVDVEFFSTAPDERITDEGILPGPDCERKVVAIYFFKMRMVQAEIRRVLYESVGRGPIDDSDPWFADMEQKIQEWHDGAPTDPAWCKPWFSGRYCQLKIFLYRPSPQVTQPSPRAAEICYDSAAYIINLSKQQMEKGATDVTWIFLLNLYMSLNVVLWSVSYANIRQAHAREDVEELVDVSLDILEQCTDRWPGTEAAVNLYSVLSRACMQSYETQDSSQHALGGGFHTPGFANSQSPPSTHGGVGASPQHGPPNPSPQFNNGEIQFGYMFNQPQQQQQQQPPQHQQHQQHPQQQQRQPQPPQQHQQAGSMNPSPFSFNASPFQQQHSISPRQPTFRSNSIFFNPSSEGGGRRFSHFAPDVPPEGGEEATPPATTTPINHNTPPDGSGGASLPTPPESVEPASTLTPPSFTGGALSTPVMTQLSPPSAASTPMTIAASIGISSPGSQASTPGKHVQQQPLPTHHSPNFNMGPTSQPQPQQQQQQQQQQIPTTAAPNWFSPSGPFVSPFAFGPMGVPYMGDSNSPGFASPTSMGPGGLISPFGSQFMNAYQRQGSLSFEQQTELMQALESDGLSEIDTLLGLGPPTNKVAWG